MTSRRSLSPMARLRIFEAASGICHLCEQRIQVGQVWEVEHVIPLALGGADDDANRSPAHVACHAEKTPIDVGRIAKAKRQKAKSLGIIRSAGKIPGSRGTKWKRLMSGQTVLR